MSNNTIPASQIVQVTPGVLSAGGSGLDLIGLILTNSTRVPIGQVLSFPSSAAVTAFFGGSSTEASLAATYFLGFINSNIKPGALLFAQYNQSAVPAYLRGGSVAALTLTQLQALSGTLTLVIDGTPITSSSISLSSATSFSNAASIIQSGFSSPGFSVTYDSVSGAFIFTNTATGSSSTIGYATGEDASASASTTSGTVLTLGGTFSGTVQIGDIVSGTDATNSLPAGCTIVNQLTGTTGKAGTYTISAAATPGALTSCTVTSTGPSGPLAVGLAMTQATGAVLSQGAAAATPSGAMNTATGVTQNFATFMTSFDPDNGSGNAQKLLFSIWNNAQNNRYLYVAWDTDITPTESTNASSSLGQLLEEGNYSGTSPINTQVLKATSAAFLCGAIASIDFTERQGRSTLAFKAGSGITPDTINGTVAQNLIENFYNFYGNYATANQLFQFFNPGIVSGSFKWIDSYINQIWMSNGFQLSLMTLLTTVKSVPYNPAGYTLIRASYQDVIDAAILFGAIQQNVPLSDAQAEEVDNAAGMKISPILSTIGWYLQILPASAIVRGNRESPPMTFWYTDGGSVQSINLSSIDVQ